MFSVSLDDLTKFATSLSGKTLTTQSGKRFLFRVRQDGYEYTPESTGKLRINESRYIEAVLHKYNESGSLRPKDYVDKTRNASYLLTVLGSYLSSRLSPDAGDFFAAPPLPEEIPAAEFSEGAVRIIGVNAYERSPAARAECIAAHRAICCICKFDFGRAYGPEFAGYIQVHHRRPLSEIRGQYKVDPVRDLCPVCPNCHAAIHYGGKLRTPEEVKELLAARVPR